MFESNNLAASGINEDESLLSANGSGINDEEDEEDVEETEDVEDGEGEDDEDEDENRGGKNSAKEKASRLYRTISQQSQTIKSLQNQISDLVRQQSSGKNVDDKLSKLYEKYDKEDVDTIKELIREETGKNLQKTSSESAEKKELARFLKDNPDISEPMLKECQWRQKQFGYSLFEAKRVITGESVKRKSSDNGQSHSISGGGNSQRSSVSSNKGKDDEAEAYKAFNAKYNPTRH